MTNAHLTVYRPAGDTNITQGKIREVIAPLFAKPNRRGVDSALRRAWKKY